MDTTGANNYQELLINFQKQIITMKQEKVREFLNQLGFGEKQVVDLSIYFGLEEDDTHSNPEFSYKNTLQTYKEDQTSLAIAQSKEKIQKDYYEENKGKWYIDTIRPLQNRLKKFGNYTVDEIEKMNIKELLEDYHAKTQSAIASASDATNEEYIKKIRGLQEQLQDKDERYMEEKEAWEIKINAAKEESTKAIEDFRVTEFLTQYISSDKVDFDIPSKKSFYAQTYIPRLKEMYRIDYQTGAIEMTDGSKAIRPDGNGYVNHVGDALKIMATNDGNWKQSNGKEDVTHIGYGQKKIVTTKTVTGKPTGKKYELDNTHFTEFAEMLKNR